MADFVSDFWSWYIIVLTVLSILACFALIWWVSAGSKPAPGEQAQSMGHVWDGDLEELNNPLPKWWLNMFYITLFFGIIYLILYPGLGSFAGILNWTAVEQHQQEVDLADNRYGAIYAEYLERDVRDIVDDPEAVKMGERLFVTYCTVCHGSDAGGVPGYPNLRDDDWLYGGKPDQIKHSILEGRNGAMPAWQDALGDQGVQEVTQHVLALAGRKHDTALAQAGQGKFATFCAGCHMPDGTGNQGLGAPNLTNNIWLYGGSPKTIAKTVGEGRNGKMPAHRDFLGEAKSHLIATYIYSLSRY